MPTRVVGAPSTVAILTVIVTAAAVAFVTVITLSVTDHVAVPEVTDGASAPVKIV